MKVKVEFGQRVIGAATGDGADQIQQLSESQTAGQTVLSIELRPVRKVRLKAEQLEKRRRAKKEAALHKANWQSERGCHLLTIQRYKGAIALFEAAAAAGHYHL